MQSLARRTEISFYNLPAIAKIVIKKLRRSRIEVRD
jgi:hypothetical protein